MLSERNFADYIPQIRTKLPLNRELNSAQIGLRESSSRQEIDQQLSGRRLFSTAGASEFRKTVTFSVPSGTRSLGLDTFRYGNDGSQYTGQISYNFEYGKAISARMHNLYEVHVERKNGQDIYTIAMTENFIGGMRVTVDGNSFLVLSHEDRQTQQPPTTPKGQPEQSPTRNQSAPPSSITPQNTNPVPQPQLPPRPPEVTQTPKTRTDDGQSTTRLPDASTELAPSISVQTLPPAPSGNQTSPNSAAPSRETGATGSVAPISPASRFPTDPSPHFSTTPIPAPGSPIRQVERDLNSDLTPGSTPPSTVINPESRRPSLGAGNLSLSSPESTPASMPGSGIPTDSDYSSPKLSAPRLPETSTLDSQTLDSQGSGTTNLPGSTRQRGQARSPQVGNAGSVPTPDSLAAETPSSTPTRRTPEEPTVAPNSTAQTNLPGSQASRADSPSSQVPNPSSVPGQNPAPVSPPATASAPRNSESQTLDSQSPGTTNLPGSTSQRGQAGSPQVGNAGSVPTPNSLTAETPSSTPTRRTPEEPTVAPNSTAQTNLPGSQTSRADSPSSQVPNPSSVPGQNPAPVSPPATASAPRNSESQTLDSQSPGTTNLPGSTSQRGQAGSPQVGNAGSVPTPNSLTAETPSSTPTRRTPEEPTVAPNSTAQTNLPGSQTSRADSPSSQVPNPSSVPGQNPAPVSPPATASAPRNSESQTLDSQSPGTTNLPGSTSQRGQAGSPQVGNAGSVPTPNSLTAETPSSTPTRRTPEEPSVAPNSTAQTNLPGSQTSRADSPSSQVPNPSSVPGQNPAPVSPPATASAPRNSESQTLDSQSPGTTNLPGSTSQRGQARSPQVGNAGSVPTPDSLTAETPSSTPTRRTPEEPSVAPNSTAQTNLPGSQASRSDSPSSQVPNPSSVPGQNPTPVSPPATASAPRNSESQTLDSQSPGITNLPGANSQRAQASSPQLPDGATQLPASPTDQAQRPRTSISSRFSGPNENLQSAGSDLAALSLPATGRLSLPSRERSPLGSTPIPSLATPGYEAPSFTIAPRPPYTPHFDASLEQKRAGLGYFSMARLVNSDWKDLYIPYEFLEKLPENQRTEIQDYSTYAYAHGYYPPERAFGEIGRIRPIEKGGYVPRDHREELARAYESTGIALAGEPPFSPESRPTPGAQSRADQTDQILKKYESVLVTRKSEYPDRPDGRNDVEGLKLFGSRMRGVVPYLERHREYLRSRIIVEAPDAAKVGERPDYVANSGLHKDLVLAESALEKIFSENSSPLQIEEGIKELRTLSANNLWQYSDDDLFDLRYMLEKAQAALEDPNFLAQAKLPDHNLWSRAISVISGGLKSVQHHRIEQALNHLSEFNDHISEKDIILPIADQTDTICFEFVKLLPYTNLTFDEVVREASADEKAKRLEEAVVAIDEEIEKLRNLPGPYPQLRIEQLLVRRKDFLIAVNQNSKEVLEGREELKSRLETPPKSTPDEPEKSKDSSDQANIWDSVITPVWAPIWKNLTEEIIPNIPQPKEEVK